jgi:hypothetical protein
MKRLFAVAAILLWLTVGWASAQRSAVVGIHYDTQYGDEGNTADEFIANKQNPQKGKFSVSIGVTGPKKAFLIQ